MRIVVIGGNGFIGSAFIRYANAHGADIVNCDYRKPEKMCAGVKYITCLHEDVCFYRDMLDEDDVVIILKWKGVPATCMENGRALIENNIVGTMFLIEACIEKRVKKIVFASSGGAIYGNQDELPINENVQARPISLYAVQKLMVEEYLRFVARTNEIQVIILRISNPYGPGQKPFNGQGIIATFMACSLLGRKAEVWGSLKCFRDYLYIDDLAECIYMCVNKDIDSGVYNVGSGVGTTISDICTYIENITGEKVNYIVKEAGSNQVKNNILDCSKIHQSIGWRSSITIENGIEKMKEVWDGEKFG